MSFIFNLIAPVSNLIFQKLFTCLFYKTPTLFHAFILLFKMLKEPTLILISILKIFNYCRIFAKIVNFSFDHEYNRVHIFFNKPRYHIYYFSFYISTGIYLISRLPESLGKNEIHISVIHVSLILAFLLLVYSMYSVVYKINSLNQVTTASVSFANDLESKNSIPIKVL